MWQRTKHILNVQLHCITQYFSTVISLLDLESWQRQNDSVLSVFGNKIKAARRLYWFSYVLSVFESIFFVLDRDHFAHARGGKGNVN